MVILFSNNFDHYCLCVAPHEYKAFQVQGRQKVELKKNVGLPKRLFGDYG